MLLPVLKHFSNKYVRQPVVKKYRAVFGPLVLNLRLWKLSLVSVGMLELVVGVGGPLR